MTLPKLHKASLEAIKKKSLLKKEDRDLLYNIGLTRAGAMIAEKYEHILDEAELMFVSHYCNPLSDGYKNGIISAMHSGHSPKQAKEMVAQDWFGGLHEIINEIYLHSAEQRLFEIMNMDPREKVKIVKQSPRGKTTTEISERINPGLLRVVSDMVKFAAERKGKGDWNPKLTLEVEAGPKTIAELFNHLNNAKLRESAIDGEVEDGSSGDAAAGQAVADGKPLLHKGQEREESPVQTE